MANSPKNSPSDDSKFGKRLDDFVESRLTDERLSNFWDRLQGTGDRSSGTPQAYRWRDFLQDSWVTLWVTRTIHKLAAGVAVAAVAVLAIVAVLARDIVLHTPPTWQVVAGRSLPTTLRFRLDRTRAALSGATSLTGRVGGSLRSAAAGLTTLDATFNGQTPEGIAITFRGTLLLTNAPGVVEIRRKNDFIGGLLTGELIVGTNVPVSVNQPYSAK